MPTVLRTTVVWACLFLFASPAWARNLAHASWPSARCVIAVSRKLNINPWLIVGLMKVEGGHPGQFVYDRNGSYDMGPMQINSLWLPRLSRIGIDARSLARNGCLNVTVGTAILSIQLKAAHGDIRKAVGWYHSHTPSLSHRYRLRVVRALQTIAKDKAQQEWR